MSFPWRRLFQSVQDDLEGLGEAVFGDRAERLLDEEIRAVDELLHRARAEHASARARRIDAEQRVQQARTSLGEAEAAVEAQLRRRRAGAARAAAAGVVDLQAQLAGLAADAATLRGLESEAGQLGSQLEHRLRRLKHQLDTQRATASLQRAQAAVARRQQDGAAHPEPAPASARRMRRSKGQGGDPATQADARAAPAPAPAPPPDPVTEVIDRIARRIKPRTAASSSSPAQARRR